MEVSLAKVRCRENLYTLVGIRARTLAALVVVNYSMSLCYLRALAKREGRYIMIDDLSRYLV